MNTSNADIVHLKLHEQIIEISNPTEKNLILE